jgi:hypothetical protein
MRYNVDYTVKLRRKIARIQLEWLFILIGAGFVVLATMEPLISLGLGWGFPDPNNNLWLIPGVVFLLLSLAWMVIRNAV